MRAVRGEGPRGRPSGEGLLGGVASTCGSGSASEEEPKGLGQREPGSGYMRSYLIYM